jgi:hypothetical protein
VAVETTHVAYSRMAVTDVPLTLAVAVALALMVSGRIELAGLAAGLAMSFKYPGIFLLVPLVVAGWRRWRRSGHRLAAAALGVLRHEPVLRRPPLERARRRAAGAAARPPGLARVRARPHRADRVSRPPLGRARPGAARSVCSGLGVALAQRRRNDLILASFVIVYFLDLCTLGAHFDRYVLPARAGARRARRADARARARDAAPARRCR